MSDLELEYKKELKELREEHKRLRDCVKNINGINFFLIGSFQLDVLLDIIEDVYEPSEAKGSVFLERVPNGEIQVWVDDEEYISHLEGESEMNLYYGYRSKRFKKT